MSRLKLFLLGPPRIECKGKPIEIGRRKAVALLVYLALSGRSHSRDALATLFWPEHDQSRARAGLRRALAALKKALGEGWLDVDWETVGLNRDAEVWLDVGQFQDRLAECWTHGHPQDQVCPACLSLLAEAAALYRDDFLAGFTLRDSPGFDEWQFFQTEGLRDELASALERLAQGHSGQGEFERAIAYARRWLALDPLHEPVHCCLMRLYAWSGQRAAALRQYGECERILREELGVPPEEETTQVYRAIKEKRDLPPPVDRFAKPVSPPKAARKHNLPVQPTPFLGREMELAELARLLTDPDVRLVTLLGPGGMGKTRLALEAAAAQIDTFVHGVYFVSLASLQSVEAIVPTVAETIGFSFYKGGEAQQQLLDYLRQRTMLLIMDGFEHLLDGVGLVTDILRTAPDVKILTSSRVRLNVQDEHLFPIAGMHYPALTPGPSPVFGRGEPKDAALRRARDIAQYSAVKLFLQSACRAQPDFELTDDNLTDVARICRFVEGMPLAILLAAAWVQMLSPAEIAAQIGQSLDFLETDLRDVPERHRSIRAVFDHSWHLLTEREREVFQALSVFRGGFTRQAARHVTGTSLRELMALVNKSLLHRMPTPSASPSTLPLDSARDELRAGLGTGERYEVHELLRQYAAEKLSQSPGVREVVRDRHCTYYAAALQRWEGDLKGPRQQAALAETEADNENARAAWNWAVEQGQVERLEQAMEGLCLFYTWRGRYQEGEAACRMAAEKLTASGDGPVLSAVEGLRVLAKTLAWQGVFSYALGRAELARQLLRQSLALLESPALASRDTRLEKAFILREMGWMTYDSDREQAKRPFEQSLALYQALGDRWGTASALHALSVVVNGLGGAHSEVKRLVEESLAIRRALGDQREIASSLRSLGFHALHQGQLEEAERLARECIAVRQEMGDRSNIMGEQFLLGRTLFLLGRFSEAHSLLEEGVAICSDLGFRRGLALLSILLGDAKAHLGKCEQARAQAQMGLALAREIDYQRGLGFALFVLGEMALIEGAYAEAQQLLQESVAVYREIGQRDELCSTIALLGVAARGLGNMSEAQQRLYEALQTITETRAFMPLMVVMPGITLLLADQGEKQRAVELYALASRYPFVANSRWFEDVVGRHIAAVAATLPPDVVAVAQARGQARDLEATVGELLVELGG
jgi:predicted ATPase/DNA-binding SARP family transcriptional activator